jgi:hypothetical protein
VRLTPRRNMRPRASAVTSEPDWSAVVDPDARPGDVLGALLRLLRGVGGAADRHSQPAPKAEGGGRG